MNNDHGHRPSGPRALGSFSSSDRFLNTKKKTLRKKIKNTFCNVLKSFASFFQIISVRSCHVSGFFFQNGNKCHDQRNNQENSYGPKWPRHTCYSYLLNDNWLEIWISSKKIANNLVFWQQASSRTVSVPTRYLYRVFRFLLMF